MARETAGLWPETHWLNLAVDSYWLWAEAWMVIGMRTAAIAAQRPGYRQEAERMVLEKWRAAFELPGRMARAKDPLAAGVSLYGKRVSANRRRLARKGL